ncbi:glycerol-3-phosphate dehydrogenase/oxidase [Solitalea sp. MAHUQ-68]|uniref:Glycerol-3-phosphate dehydrogenase/oxidase n=1 Tax=Solitalea agri TaxID=2953739 RepID=A0A9X2EZK4_9SPHI|nr:glycerol-3-phosphate dehydrogenase/oxidase [Solitalea agri]MCO4291962.1 glycerol-3-phosphate dehydrogenase/oxidase [Solitalea agri]
MKRTLMLAEIETMKGLVWDVIIIGGGATGLGAAVEATTRGYKTLLLEQEDFAKGTSSRSTKLIHGGVRYLQQGNLSLVLEALKERGLLIQNAPHLVHNLSFIVPNYSWWSGPFYGIGLKFYDLLAGKLGLGPSEFLSVNETLDHIPTLEQDGLKGGVIYHDGQFDDARLAINLAQTAADNGATLINYFKVNSFIKEQNLIAGVLATDQITSKEYELKAKVVINATGVFADTLIQTDNPKASKIVSPSQGIHLVFDRKFLPGESAIMVPQTDDGRVLFAIPWHNKVVVGTTDTAVDAPQLEPKAQASEIEFILKHAARYLEEDPTAADVRSVFAGLRPLVKNGNGNSTSALSRDHTILVSESGLLTVTGGKWTTYRRMGEDVIDKACLIGGLEEKSSVTSTLRIHGWKENVNLNEPLNCYGADADEIRTLIKDAPHLSESIHPNLPYIKAEVIWAIRNEMAITVEDILARRTRSLFLDAAAAIECSKSIAELMALELNLNQDWINDQVSRFSKVAENYRINI